MNKLYLDIETIPAPEHARSFLELLHQKKDEKKGEETDFEQFLLDTSFDGAFGRILCICVAVNDDKVQTLVNEKDEKAMLEDFWDIAGRADLFVGHNIKDFDLPFILQRSVILGVKPSWKLYLDPGESKFKLPAGVKYLDFARYINSPIFDTMWEWTHWGDSRKNKGLEHLAFAMGIPTPKEGIDGSRVYEFYKAGKTKEVADYCARDVETVRKVYKQLIFEGLSPRETLPF